MIFISQRPNNDPEPWLSESGERDSRRDPFTPGNLQPVFAPRPDFTQTRDPFPYRCGGVDGNALGRAIESMCTITEWKHFWSPRHEEFDTPVNPILAAFRFTWDRDATHFLATSMISEIDKKRWDSYLAPEVQAHARRVLHLLAVISE